MKIGSKKFKTYAISIFIAEAVGAVSAFLTSMGMEKYSMVEKPALTPPDIVFPIVWTVLYALMGISSARIWMNEPSRTRTHGLLIYGIQLFFNFVWSILFFNFQQYGFAFVWLVALWALILLMIVKFNEVDKIAAILQIPYLLWVTFAAYLNYMVWMLNK